VPAPGRQNAQSTEGAQQAAAEEPQQAGGGFFNSIWNLGPGGAVTRLQEQLSAPTSQQGQGAEQPNATGYRTPWGNPRGAATAPQQNAAPTLQGDGRFATLVSRLRASGGGAAEGVRELAAGLASSYGMTEAEVADMAIAAAGVPDPATSRAAPPATIRPEDAQRIQTHGMFQDLVANLGTTNTAQQRVAAAAIAQDLGLSVGQVLTQAQVAAGQPMPGYRSPWSGQ
jgi:hypothetical protein